MAKAARVLGKSLEIRISDRKLAKVRHHVATRKPKAAAGKAGRIAIGHNLAKVRT
jgi:hypothetical protein